MPVPALTELHERIPKTAEDIEETRQKENLYPGARQPPHSDYWPNVSPDNHPIPYRGLRRSKRRLEHKKHWQINLLKGE